MSLRLQPPQPLQPRCSKLVLVTLLLGISTSCDSFRQGANPEMPVWQRRPGMALSLVGQTPLTFEGRNFDSPVEKGRPALDTKNRRAFVGTSDHGLYAIRLDTAQIEWRFETIGAVQS